MDDLAAENSGHVSVTVKHSQYECTVVERLEDDQVISVCADPYRVAQVWTRRVVIRSARDLLAVLPYLSKCARTHFARSLVNLVYLRSRRSRTSAAGFGLPLRRPFSISPRRPSITAWRRF
jgi:hypothetical protein